MAYKVDITHECTKLFNVTVSVGSCFLLSTSSTPPSWYMITFPLMVSYRRKTFTPATTRPGATSGSSEYFEVGVQVLGRHDM